MNGYIEVYMKKKLIFTALLLTIFTLPAKAIITSDEVCSEESLKNRGYSDYMARLVTEKSAQAAAKVPEIEDQPDYRKNTNWIRKFFIYLDPALDDEPFLQHNIHPVPSVHDL